MLYERSNGRVDTGVVVLTEREQLAMQAIGESFLNALHQRIPISLELVEADLQLELRRREDPSATSRRRRRRAQERH